MSAMKRVLENSFLYTFSQLLVKGIGFLLLPLYTYFLTPDDYGIVNLINSFLQISLYIITFSLGSGIMRFYVDYKDDHKDLKRYLGTIIIFVIISSIIFIILGFLFNNLLIRWFFEDIDFFPYVFIALITVLFIILHRIHQDIMQAMQQGRKLTLINLAVFFITVIFNVTFIVILQYGAVGMLLAQLIVMFGYAFYIVYDLRKNNLFTVCLDLKILWSALKYSIPLIPHNLSTRLASFVSRVLLNIGGAVATVGLYSVSMQFSQLIDTVQSSVNKAFQPWFFEMMKESNKKSKEQIIKLSTLLLTLYSLIYMIIGLFSQEAILIMTSEKYVMAWTVIPILVIAFSVKSIYYFYVNILYYYKYLAKKVFISTLTGSFVDILLAFTLISFMGMYGAALAFLLAKVIVVIIVVFMAKSHNRKYIGYRLFTMIKIITTSLIFMGIGLFFSYTKYLTIISFTNILYKTCVLIAYLLFIYLTNRVLIKEYVISGKIRNILKKKRK